MNNRIIPLIVLIFLVLGAVISPLDILGMNFKENVVTVSAESKEAVKLDEEVLYYDDFCQETKQIPCEERSGIYFLNGEKLLFYSVDNEEYALVYTFQNVDNAYVAKDKLYILNKYYSSSSGYCSEITVYDLIAQEVKKTIEFNQYSNAIGVDDSGRIYLAGLGEEKYAIYLLSPDGELLSQVSTGNL